MENNIFNEIDKINSEIESKICELTNVGKKDEAVTPNEIVDGVLNDNFLSNLPKSKPSEEIIGYLKM